jgi:DNA repair exonuclease SbcCD ATPase subunit
MIEFKELYLENFRSWKRLHLVDLDKKGLCLVQAPNGAGKSSLRQAIEYLLLDKTSDQIPVSDLVRDGDKSCLVYCKLVKNDSVIEITKYRNHDEFGNRILLVINGDDSLTYTDRRETQKEIVNLLELDANYLFASSIFSSNTSSFVELNDTSKKDILYKVCNLEEYIQYYDKADTKCKQIKADIEKFVSKKDNLKEQIESYKEEIEDLKEKSKNFDINIKTEISDKKKIIEKIEQEISELRVKVERLEEDYERLEVDNSLIPINNLPIEKEIEDLEKRRADVVEKITETKSNIKHLNENISKVSNNTCPVLGITCSTLSENIEMLESKYGPKLKKENNKLSTFEEQKIGIGDEIVNLRFKLIVKDDTQLNKIKQQIQEVESNIKRYTEKIEYFESTIKELKTRENTYIDIIKSKQKSIIDIENKLSNLDNKIDKLIHIYEYFLFWKTGFSRKGIPNLKLESFISEIEDKVNSNLSTMKDSIFVSIQATKTISSGESREEITYTINHPTKPIKNYKSYSSGEKQRIKTADLFAFANMFSKLNILILDEVLELSLDDLGKEEVFDLMKEQSKNFGSVFVISHSSAIQDKFDNVIKIKKINNISKIEE